MGHIRLGRLPKSRVWNQVVELLDEEPENLVGIASAILIASESHLSNPGTLETGGRAFAVLVSLAQAAETGTLADTLAVLGVQCTSETPVITVLADLGDRVRQQSTGASGSGQFGEMAGLALRHALTETVGLQGKSLFGSTLDELEQGFRRATRGDQFGNLTRLFFGDLLARFLRSAVDRELSCHVAHDQSLGDPGAAREFSNALDRYARETAAIVQRFATDWYAKRQWKRQEAVTYLQAVGFTKVALLKLQSDLTFARTLG